MIKKKQMVCSFVCFSQKKSRKAAMDQRHKEYDWTILCMQIILLANS